MNCREFSRLAQGVAGALILSAAVSGAASSARAEEMVVGLITKTDTIPFFVKMREAATEEAGKLGVKLVASTGKFDGDTESQVAAIENLISLGAKGIMITPSNSTAILSAVKEARDKGIIVIALDTPTEPPEAVDATMATDNFKAGEYQGTYARLALGGKAPKIVMLDGTSGSSVSELRHDGYLKGMGLAEGDPAIVGAQFTNGATDKAQAAMENLLAAHPDINAVYSINETAAAGAYAAIKAAGLENDIVLTAIDGGCAGVKNVADGKTAATVMQFPRKMAALGVKAIVDAAKGGAKPSGFIDTGSEVITDKPFAELPSKDTAFGAKACWG
ncbi:MULTISPECIES: substrate-binding domain-containing protein [unclassified Aureimonas]|uniref:substrate-binding domain-containing protein n=1 Tax=unclassified Aureimonas TaxID=2615206 RepID=UPI0006F615EC|nr:MULTISPECIES: substrate-binding domain-containing protein [unclassified Aureimonas]KQT61224.1 sugar ABC transporter [Aureimonas sp. Leaf460]KQT68673.1 sugar ABC transporter [Aureimonas sp. Leaf427]